MKTIAQIVTEVAHRTATEFRHVDRIRYGFTEQDMHHYTLTLLATLRIPAVPPGKESRDALRSIYAKLKTTTICHPSIIPLLTAEALALAEVAMEAAQP